MAKGKGLSFEEKRRRMLDIFKDDPSFFHLKDIEKFGTKKGIIFQSIKEVLDSLVNDNLVECEKIGSSNFYWALPSKIYQAKKNKLEKNIQTIKNNEEEIENLKQQIKAAKSERIDSSDRKNKLAELNELTEKESSLRKKIDDINKYHPKRYNEYINDGKQLVVMIDLWKDNIYTLQNWLKSKNPDTNLVDLFPQLETLNLFD